MNKVLSTVVVSAMVLTGCGTTVDTESMSATPEEPPLSTVSIDIAARGKDFPSRTGDRPILPSLSHSTASPKPKSMAKVKPRITKPKKVKPIAKPKRVYKTKPKAKRVVTKRYIKPDRPISMSRIAKCIGKWESGNNPKAQNRSTSASGYFQFTDGTWNNFKGYAKAKYAPLSIQLKKFIIVWDNGRGASNWTVRHKCGY